MEKSYGFELLIVFEDESESWDYVFTDLEEEDHETVLRCAEKAIRQKQEYPDHPLLEFEDWTTPDMQEFKKGLENCALWNLTCTELDCEHDLDNSKLYFWLPTEIYKEAAERLEQEERLHCSPAKA